MANVKISDLTDLAESPVVGDLLVLVDVSDTTDSVDGTTKQNKAQYGLGSQVNAQTGTTYTVLATDFRKLVTHTNGSAIAVTLPQAGATFPAGWWCDVQNRGAGAVTITPTTSTIDGAASLVLNQNEGCRIVSDGTDYFTQRGKGSGSAGGSAGGALTGSYPNPDLASGVAGNGLALSSNVLSVNVDDSTIEINTDTLRAKDGGITAAKLATNVKTTTLIFIIDGGGATITTGIKGDLTVDFGCTINSVTLLADQSGSIVVDIWKDTYANFPPTDADSITASAVPTISTTTKSQDSTLTGWTTSISAGDILRFNVDSITTCQRVTVALKVTLT